MVLMPDFITKDKRIKKLIKSRTANNKDFWSFRNNSCDEHARSLMQYPAMMVPRMQRELIGILLAVDPHLNKIYDPFMGSGTILLEAMLRDKEFKGRDINPLALLICKVKRGPFFIKALAEKKELLFQRLNHDKGRKKEVNFPNIDKWFRDDIQISLSKIKRAIVSEKSKWCRRFFWVALAETVRLSSNSRTSTFKLHIRPKDEIKNRNIDARRLFITIANDTFDKYKKIYEILLEKRLLKRGRYKKNIELLHGDSSLPNLKRCEKQDLIVTSPPYGDNITTVTYGQFSYLPLQWIDLDDIDDSIDPSLLNSTHRIDTESLGGSSLKALDSISLLSKKSKTFKKYKYYLSEQPIDRLKRISAFYRDFDKSLEMIIEESKPSAHMIWTVGNRSVGNKTIEMDKILTELLENKDVRKITSIKRKIPSKRMAIRNSISTTMRDESILIFQRGGV